MCSKVRSSSRWLSWTLPSSRIPRLRPVFPLPSPSSVSHSREAANVYKNEFNDYITSHLIRRCSMQCTMQRLWLWGGGWNFDPIRRGTVHKIHSSLCMMVFGSVWSFLSPQKYHISAKIHSPIIHHLQLQSCSDAKSVINCAVWHLIRHCNSLTLQKGRRG